LSIGGCRRSTSTRPRCMWMEIRSRRLCGNLHRSRLSSRTRRSPTPFGGSLFSCGTTRSCRERGVLGRGKGVPRWGPVRRVEGSGGSAKATFVPGGVPGRCLLDGGCSAVFARRYLLEGVLFSVPGLLGADGGIHLEWEEGSLLALRPAKSSPGTGEKVAPVQGESSPGTGGRGKAQS